MSLTKTRASIWSGQTLTAGAGNTSSSVIDVSGSYGTQVDIKITNGGTGPTIPAQCQIQVGMDSGGTLLINFGGALVGSVVNSDVISWSVELPIGVSSFKLVAGSNTGQNCTIDADYCKVTSV